MPLSVSLWVLFSKLHNHWVWGVGGRGGGLGVAIHLLILVRCMAGGTFLVEANVGLVSMVNGGEVLKVSVEEWV